MLSRHGDITQACRQACRQVGRLAGPQRNRRVQLVQTGRQETGSEVSYGTEIAPWPPRGRSEREQRESSWLAVRLQADGLSQLPCHVWMPDDRTDNLAPPLFIESGPGSCGHGRTQGAALVPAAAQLSYARSVRQRAPSRSTQA